MVYKNQSKNVDSDKKLLYQNVKALLINKTELEVFPCSPEATFMDNRQHFTFCSLHHSDLISHFKNA